jgi:hypothetical protein
MRNALNSCWEILGAAVQSHDRFFFFLLFEVDSWDLSTIFVVGSLYSRCSISICYKSEKLKPRQNGGKVMIKSVPSERGGSSSIPVGFPDEFWLPGKHICLSELGWKGTNNTRERVAWGRLATAAPVGLHSYLLSLCLWGFNRSHPHAQGECSSCTEETTVRE